MGTYTAYFSRFPRQRKCIIVQLRRLLDLIQPKTFGHLVHLEPTVTCHTFMMYKIASLRHSFQA